MDEDMAVIPAGCVVEEAPLPPRAAARGGICWEEGGRSPKPLGNIRPPNPVLEISETHATGPPRGLPRNKTVLRSRPQSRL